MPLLDLVCIGYRLGAVGAGPKDGIGIREEASGKGSMAMDGVFKEENKAGIGVVIHDDSGQVIASMYEKTSLLSSIDEIEALVAVRALIFTQEVGISSIILGGDSEKIINSFKNGEVSFAFYDHLIHEEAKFIAESFVVFNVSHINKQGNSIAHNLARHVRYDSNLLVWMKDVPSYFHAIMLADLTS
nr:hypothetical protein CFP56_55805 [Quercus suber]